MWKRVLRFRKGKPASALTKPLRYRAAVGRRHRTLPATHLERLEERKLLAYSATIDLVALTVTFAGDAASDILIFDADARGRLRHNRFTTGDPGFASNIDLDTTLAGVQSATAGNRVFVNAGAGNDTINLGTPAFPASELDVPFTVDGEAGADSLNLDDTASPFGTEGQTDSLTSTQFANFLSYSNLENLMLSGGPGEDQIDVLSTADGTLTRLNGGGGNDSAIVRSTGTAGLILDGQAGTDSATIFFGNLAGPVTVVDYGGTFTGSGGNDSIVLTDTQITSAGETVDLSNTAVIPTLTGGGGNDSINASAASRPAVLDGGGGNDSITGGGQNDTILGADGDDQLVGGSGDDLFVFTNGWGSDTVEADGTADHDRVDFSAVNADLTITLGSVTVQDAAGNIAQHTANRIETVIGGSGNDTAICTAATGKLMLQLLAGNDSVNCSDSPVGLIIDAGDGNDTLIGSSQNDVLIGGGGQDSLVGNDGNDTLVGGPGNDVIEDSSGDNSLVGGVGCDTTNGTADPPSCAFPTVEFSAASSTVREAGRSALITVTLANPAAGSSSVSYSITADTATAGIDFTARTGTLTFSSGQTTRTFTVSIRNDRLDEDDETVRLMLTATTGQIGMGEITQATLTIQDDDALPSVRFSRTALSVREPIGVARLTVSLSAASGRTVNVDLTTINASAQDGSDYTGTGGGDPRHIVFVSGQRTQVIQIPIINDPDVEPNETFLVRLSNPANATLPAAGVTATVTIVSDDVAAAVISIVMERSARRSKLSSFRDSIDEVLREFRPRNELLSSLLSHVR